MLGYKNTIKQSIDIVNYIGKYVKLVKVGRFYKGLCPFHAEREPSFTVDPQKQGH
jgi:DNA primase